MLYWTGIFFVIAVVSAVLGFGTLASSAAAIAQILFFLFLTLFVISLVASMAGPKT